MGTRWTPLAVLVAVASVVLVGIGVVAVVAHEDDDDRPATEAVIGGDVTTTITVLPDTTTSTTAPLPETTTTSPPTTVARTTTTRAGATTPTTRRPTTTRAPTTSTTSAQPLCAADQIDISGRPDRLSYPAGQPVSMSTTIRNRSLAPCFYRGYTVEMRFLDPGGRTIIAQVVHADDRDHQTFAPGQSITHTATWDPARQCVAPPCTPPRPDIYSVQAIWSFSGGRYTALQQYVLT